MKDAGRNLFGWPRIDRIGSRFAFSRKIEGSFEAARHLCACSVLDRGRNGGLAMDIRFEKVAFTYQPHSPFEQRVLFDIDLEIKEGSYTALVGHTGSGKSTLLQHLNALLKPTAGKVTIGDRVITPETDNKNLKPLRKK